MQALIASLIFLAALLAPPFLAFLGRRRWGLPVRVVVDPADPRPEDVCAYLAEIARRLDERPERLRVTFDGRNTRNRSIRLDLDSDRHLRVIVEGHRPKTLDLRGRWIADHPVPLDLRRAVLYVEPVDANRFRVGTSVPFAVPILVYLLCSVVACVGCVLLRPACLAAAAGLALGCLVARRGSAA